MYEVSTTLPNGLFMNTCVLKKKKEDMAQKKSTLGYYLETLLNGGVIEVPFGFKYCQKDGKAYIVLDGERNVSFECRKVHEVPFSYIWEACRAILMHDIMNQKAVAPNRAIAMVQELRVLEDFLNPPKQLLAPPTFSRRTHLLRNFM